MPNYKLKPIFDRRKRATIYKDQPVEILVYEFWVPADQVMNYRLEQIKNMSGINKPLSMHIVRYRELCKYQILNRLN